jgi:hypothetical protein
VSSLYQWALDKAVPDVRATLEWLDQAGFTITDSRGGEHEGFGNVFLQFQRTDVGVRVTRDRGQWFFDISPPGRPDYLGLHVLLTAKEDGEPDPGPRNAALSQPLAEQLPKGVSWQSVVPSLIAWLEETDRTDSIVDADRRWREAMKRYWNEP